METTRTERKEICLKKTRHFKKCTTIEEVQLEMLSTIYSFIKRVPTAGIARETLRSTVTNRGTVHIRFKTLYGQKLKHSIPCDIRLEWRKDKRVDIATFTYSSQEPVRNTILTRLFLNSDQEYLVYKKLVKD
jgi:hypothetical protein